ncbi:MAG: hypothetical protein ACHQ52_05090 [Candidatus Eisenbacteria bacterium]
MSSLILVVACALPPGARAQAGFPTIPIWAYPGIYHASTGAPGDTITHRSRTITVRWMRDPAAEARSDFGGYRIYRIMNAVVNGQPDTSRAELVRRFSVQLGDSLFLWHFPRINSGTPLDQRVVSFVDPDSSGNFVKRCRTVDEFGRCTSRGDSIFVLVGPPGPHDGFRTWYTITYEKRNQLQNDFEDLFVKDPTCTDPDTANCLNLNNKARNLIPAPVEPTAGPTANVEDVWVVPNPYRASEAWDLNGASEVHFTNLPKQAHIQIFTVAGDLVRELDHNDPVRDFERWDLKNSNGLDVASGIYMFRVTSGSFHRQNRFIVIR